MNRLNGWPLTAVQSFSVTAGTSVLSAVMEESYTIKDSSQESRVWKSRDFHGFLYMQLLIRPLVRKHGRIVTAAALRIMMAPQCRLINHYSLFSFTRSRHYHHNPILSLHQSHAVEIDGTGYTGHAWSHTVGLILWDSKANSMISNRAGNHMWDSRWDTEVGTVPP